MCSHEVKSQSCSSVVQILGLAIRTPDYDWCRMVGLCPTARRGVRALRPTGFPSSRWVVGRQARSLGKLGMTIALRPWLGARGGRDHRDPAAYLPLRKPESHPAFRGVVQIWVFGPYEPNRRRRPCVGDGASPTQGRRLRKMAESLRRTLVRLNTLRAYQQFSHHADHPSATECPGHRG